MIINSQRKVILYNMPRTGTLSLATAARNARSNANVKLDYITEGHSNYEDLRGLIASGDALIDHNQGKEVGRMARSGYEYNKPLPITSVDELDNYEQYVFVRDPFERAKSAINLFRRGRLHHILLTIHYGHDYFIPCTQRDDDYDNFPQSKKDRINAISYIQAFRHLKWWFEKGSVLTGHFGFIEGPVQPLQFSDFANQSRHVMTRLGIPPNIELPHENSAKYIEEYDGLSPKHEKEIKDYFGPDYEYLAKKGIHFTK
jgi:hypothetical protein